MELREILALDAETLTAVQAQQVAKDVIDVVSRGVQASDQKPLRALLIRAQEIATGRKIGDQHDTIRQDVLTKIQEAEARGDKRTARYLAESMAKADMIAADLADRAASDAAQKYIENDIAESEARLKAQQQEQIDATAQELLRVNGSQLGYSMKKARQQATREVVGPAPYEDDVNEVVEKPDRQAILDAHRNRL